MSTIRIGAVALAVGICLGSASSYRDATTAKQISSDTWYIDASGNGFTSRSEVMEYSYRKAAEVCPSGFDVVDNDRSSTENDVTFDGGKTYQTVSKPTSVLVVRCRRGGNMNSSCRGELCR